jgi:TonB family protein
MVPMKALLLLAALGSTSPAATADLDTLLKQPISPGSMALLVSHLEDERAQRQVWLGLENDDPRVRAAAARVAHVRGMRGAAGAMMRQLEKETDGVAGFEELRALSTFADGSDAPLVAEARRLGVLSSFIGHLARLRGPAALVYLREPEMRGGMPRHFLDFATRGWTEGTEEAARIAVHDPVHLQSVLRTATAMPRPLPPDVVVSSLRAADAEVRAAAYWYLAAASPQEIAALGAAAGTALDASPDRAPRPDPSPRLAFGLELANRAIGRAPSSRKWSRDIETMAPLGAGWPSFARVLTEDEKKKLRKVLTRAPAASPTLFKAAGYPAGLASSLLQAAGCDPAPGVVGVAEIAYRPDGRASRVGILDVQPPGACADAHKAALALALAPETHRLDKPIHVFTAFTPEGMECLDQPPRLAQTAGAPVRAGGLSEIDEPRVVRRVPPNYPESARQGGIQGQVVLEGLISEGGCLDQLMVLEGVDPALDMAALLAVSGWRYTPTLLNGVQVPVIMTITVNFKLN